MNGHKIQRRSKANAINSLVILWKPVKHFIKPCLAMFDDAWWTFRHLVKHQFEFFIFYKNIQIINMAFKMGFNCNLFRCIYLMKVRKTLQTRVFVWWKWKTFDVKILFRSKGSSNKIFFIDISKHNCSIGGNQSNTHQTQMFEHRC